MNFFSSPIAPFEGYCVDTF